MNNSDNLVAIVLAVVGLFSIFFLPREMKRKLGDPTIRARLTKNGLIGAYALYWLGILCSTFMMCYCVYRLWKANG
jgi:tellurite resistance protein TehA-like permease